jgi:hypothetical protein
MRFFFLGTVHREGKNRGRFGLEARARELAARRRAQPRFGQRGLGRTGLGRVPPRASWPRRRVGPRDGGKGSRAGATLGRLSCGLACAREKRKGRGATARNYSPEGTGQDGVAAVPVEHGAGTGVRRGGTGWAPGMGVQQQMVACVSLSPPCSNDGTATSTQRRWCGNEHCMAAVQGVEGQENGWSGCGLDELLARSWGRLLL